MNYHVFRWVRATLEVFNVHVMESNQQHSRFTVDNHSTIVPPPDPNYGPSPGFIITNLGRLQVGILDIIIQIDGSWDKTNGSGGASWVAICSTCAQFSRQEVFLFASSTLHTEVVACLSAINWVRTTIFSNILIIMDLVLLIRFLGSQTNADITIHHILNAIREVSTSFQWCRILKVSRDQVHQDHMTTLHCRMNRFNLV